MNLMRRRIKDKACTICDGIYPSGRTKCKARCDKCIANNMSEWCLRR